VRKPDSLRTWLLRAVVGLAARPERLNIFIEEGTVVCRPGETLSYMNRYNLIITIEDFEGPSEAIFVPILAWISDHQPELLDSDSGELSYRWDVLDSKLADFEMTMPLYEAALISPTDQGGWAVTYPVEDVFPEQFEGLGLVRLRALYLEDGEDHDLVASHPDYVAPEG
jgi:P2 phage tail completion protein R (GpR)